MSLHLVSCELTKYFLDDARENKCSSLFSQYVLLCSVFAGWCATGSGSDCDHGTFQIRFHLVYPYNPPFDGRIQGPCGAHPFRLY